MRAVIIAVAALSLSSCAGLGLTPRQSMYAAYGSYSAALEGAVAYAQSPSASPAVVARLNAANKAAPVQTAVKYGRAYTRCLGRNETIVEGIDCKAFDFRPNTASGYAATLRSIVVTLTSR
jgi:hypothetical protein